MTFSKEKIKKCVDLLKADADTADVAKVLQEMVDDNESRDIQLINRNHYFASVLWQEQDIKEELVRNGIPDSDENVEEVFLELNPEALNNCEDGWAVIDSIISELQKQGRFKEEPARNGISDEDLAAESHRIFMIKKRDGLL